MQRNNMSRTPQKITLLLFVLAFCSLGAAAYLYDSIISTKEEIQSVMKEVYAEATLDSRIAMTQKIIQETEKDRKELLRFYVHKEDIVGFIEYIERLGKAEALSTTISSVLEKKESYADQEFPVLALSLQARGTLAGTVAYLKRIEQIPYRVFVKQVSFSRSEDEKKKSIWTLYLDFSVLKDKE